MTTTIPEDYQPAADLLKDRVLLITGAGDGLGRALSLSAARCGATVILLGRTTRKLEEVYDQICEDGCPEPAIVPMNLESATPKQYDELYEVIEREFGRLDGLVHNAAIVGRQTTLAQYDLENWYKVLQVNLNAPFLLTQTLLPLLLNSDSAPVLLISDSAGRAPRAYWGAYGVSKAAAEALFSEWADELEKSSLRFNSLDPGPLRTRFRTRSFPGEVPATNPPPELVTPSILYLLGRDGAEIRGERLTLDTNSK
jgi:NAD(P)-dependent dehydrogenase (short-subunit alcohol dehydrogenase family)